MSQKNTRASLSPQKIKSRMLLLSLVRRFVQLAILTLFIGTARLGWTLLGEPLLNGTLTSSMLAGTIPLSDPFVLLQKLAAGHKPEMVMVTGALVVLAIYILAGGRAFCAWVCPMNIVTDAAYASRKALGLSAASLRLSRNSRYALAVAALAASAITGTAAFEWINPQAFLWREIVWGVGAGFVAAGFGVFALDLILLERGWCGHLCPLGAFWSLVGKVGVTKPLFDNDRCTKCGDCLRVCPEPHVLNFKQAAARGFIASGECTNCGRCAAVCPENAIRFATRFQAKPAQTHQDKQIGDV